jgi:hypothetical protein
MDNDAKRAHHDLGGVSKFMYEAVDVEPHGLTAFDGKWTRSVVCSGERRS